MEGSKPKSLADALNKAAPSAAAQHTASGKSTISSTRAQREQRLEIMRSTGSGVLTDVEAAAVLKYTSAHPGRLGISTSAPIGHRKASYSACDVQLVNGRMQCWSSLFHISVARETRTPPRVAGIDAPDGGPEHWEIWDIDLVSLSRVQQTVSCPARSRGVSLCKVRCCARDGVSAPETAPVPLGRGGDSM